MMEIVKIEKNASLSQIAADLIKQYSVELNIDLTFQELERELNNPLDKYGKEGAALFLGFYQHEPVGCVALQGLINRDTCEMKRLFVKPPFRKMGFANNLVNEVLAEAKILGYRRMVLDTLISLEDAVRLYRKFGFISIPAYYQNPLPGVLFMEKLL